MVDARSAYNRVSLLFTLALLIMRRLRLTQCPNIDSLSVDIASMRYNRQSSLHHRLQNTPVKLSGDKNAGLPADFLIRSSPSATNISETPKSHSLTVWRSADRRILSGFTCRASAKRYDRYCGIRLTSRWITSFACRYSSPKHN
jgi:hypothetical protein